VRGARRKGTEELLERDAERAEIGEVVRRCAGGAGRLLALLGPAGIGKTRLLEELSSRASDAGLAVLSARCGELERDYPLGVARQLFEPALMAADEPARTSLLSGPAALAEPLLLGVPAADPPGDPALATLHAFYWLVSNLAEERPIALVVDDVHWADSASLRALLYLSRRLDELPALIAVAGRPAEPGGEAELLPRLFAEPRVHAVWPLPLSAAAVTTIVRRTVARDADDGFCRACWRATGGNPYLLRELMAELESADVGRGEPDAGRVPRFGPRRVAHGVLLRVARLSEAAPALAQAVAVLGRGATLPHASELAGLTPGDAAVIADELAAADILVAGHPLSFVHPVVRTAIYNDFPPAQRARLHARAARMLAGEGEPPDVVATHLMASEPWGDSWVVERLREAASVATSRGAPEAAIEVLRRALAEPPTPEARPGLLRELGLAESRAFLPTAIERLQEAQSFEQTPQGRATVGLDLGRAHLLAGRLADAVETFESAIRELDGRDPDLALRLEAALLETTRMDVAANATVAERLECFRHRVHAAGAGAGARAIAANLAFEDVRAGSSAARVKEEALRALGDGRLIAEETAEAPVFYFAASALILSDDFSAAERALGEAAADARRRGSVVALAGVLCWRSLCAYRRGDLDGAEADARESLDVSRMLEQANFPNAVAALMNVLIDRDDPAGAEDALTRSEFTEDALRSVTFNILLNARGRLRVAQGQVDAVEDFLSCGRRQLEWGAPNPAMLAWRSNAALALHDAGEHDQALALAREEVERARRFGAPRALGIGLRCLGLCEGNEQGLAALGEAVEMLRRSPARLELGRALGSRGAALRRAGRLSDARALLREALDIAHRCGASALERETLGELSIAGIRPRRTALSGVEALTASERRIAELATRQQNREIAQALFVSPRTVEGHLTSVYGKLGITSRGELAAALILGGAAT